MGTRMVRLTVLFEPPFWIGLCEREEDGQYAVRRIVFGAEPREQGKAARRVQQPVPSGSVSRRGSFSCGRRSGKKSTGGIDVPCAFRDQDREVLSPWS